MQLDVVNNENKKVGSFAVRDERESTEQADDAGATANPGAEHQSQSGHACEEDCLTGQDGDPER